MTVVFPSATEPLVEITREGPLFIMTMVDKENRFTTEMCKAICDALDHVADSVDKEGLTEAALVTRGQDKFYSNGLHFEKALTIPGFTDHTFMPMLNKILMFGIPTIACLNGHAFAGGCLMAMAHDYRVMRSDRGFLCMNEIDLPAPLPAGMSALLRYKMQPHVYRSVVLEAKRYAGKDALANNLVDGIAEGIDSTFELAKQVALKIAPKAKSGAIYALIKEDMFPEISSRLMMNAKL
ncbi:ClpP/crotonase-like domain-containing protein [Dissophora ornata]|nr:ClpP/crotonase-like domain-containing protein [Dissophora ornata]